MAPTRLVTQSRRGNMPMSLVKWRLIGLLIFQSRRDRASPSRRRWAGHSGAPFTATSSVSSRRSAYGDLEHRSRALASGPGVAVARIQDRAAGFSLIFPDIRKRPRGYRGADASAI